MRNFKTFLFLGLTLSFSMTNMAFGKGDKCKNPEILKLEKENKELEKLDKELEALEADLSVSNDELDKALASKNAQKEVCGKTGLVFDNVKKAAALSPKLKNFDTQFYKVSIVDMSNSATELTTLCLPFHKKDKIVPTKVMNAAVAEMRSDVAQLRLEITTKKIQNDTAKMQIQLDEMSRK